MTDQSSMGKNIEIVQFYDNVNYDNLCNNILNINKNYIQKYVNELNEIPKDLDKQIDDKFIKLQRTIQSANDDSKEKKGKKISREYIRNILMKEQRYYYKEIQ